MKQLTTELAWTVFGGALIAAVIGLMGYFIFIGSKAEALEPAASTFNVSVIGGELKRTPETLNAFVRMSKLGQPVPQAAQTVTYQTGDLGKTNIGQIGQ